MNKLAAFLASTVIFAMASHAGAAPKPSLTEPSMSPDGREIAFASGGDLWTVPSSGGTASLLVTDPATESRPLWSPDGKELAFTSTRNGSANVYVLRLQTNQIRRLTWSDAYEQLDAWSPDGKWLYFSSGANDVRGQNDIFRVAATGGTPLEVSRERYLNEFNAAPSPDGQSLALMAKGGSSDQWWRNGHAHIDEAELWLMPVAPNAPYRKLASGGAKRLWPMWRPDGRGLYLMSDQSGSENIWSIPLDPDAPATKVTAFTSGRVLYPSISYDGRSIVFERELAIWKLDTATGQAAEVPVTLRGAPAASGERRIYETSFRSMAVSPDGKKAALIAHGEVFATSAAEGGPSVRITQTIGEESDLTWSPNSKRLAYVSERGFGAQIMEYDFATQKERALTKATDVDAAPVYSPDGKLLAYAHGLHELHVIAFGDGKAPAKDARIFTGPLDRDDITRVTWSPDSKWIAFAATDRRSFRNVWVIPAAGGQPQQVSFFANGRTGERIAWSPDGKYLVFDTSQRSEARHLVRVDLLPHTPKYREDAFRDLFDDKKPAPADSTAGDDKAAPTTPDASATATGKNAKDAKPKIDPVKIVFEGIRERATFIPIGLSADEPIISPDGKQLVFRSVDDQNLYCYSLDELAKEPPSPQQLSQGKKTKRDYAFSPDSKRLRYLDGGHITETPLENAKPKTIDASAEMVAAFDAEKQVVFDQAWFLLNRFFYDPKFHGQDWKAQRERFEPYVQGAQTADELRRIVNLMIGELNASHLGIYRPRDGYGGPPAQRVGDLGLRFDRDAYEAGRGLLVREVVKLGPAFNEGSIKAGDTLTAVDARPLGPGVNLDGLLLDRAGKRTVLTFSSGGKTREAVVRPVLQAVAAGLLYRDWVSDRRALVEKLSGGRLGYVHLFDMSSSSLNQLYIDLDAQNQGREGVVIDVRNNNGGFVNGHVLDVFSRKNFLTMTPRELFAVPSRQNLGQRALGLPTVLVTNESSLSDAEDFTEGYRALGLGKIVGTPTAGWIIYTDGRTLIDGSIVRIPTTRIEGADGQNMEGNPRKVDVEVVRQLGETLSGKDSQLEVAVSTLLLQVGPKR
jgi:Tol biopolymer transport system component/C-terminal processing protease CtpA/Prc